MKIGSLVIVQIGAALWDLNGFTHIREECYGIVADFPSVAHMRLEVITSYGLVEINKRSVKRLSS